MLMSTNEQLSNLMFLRDVAIPLAREREKQGRLDWDSAVDTATGCLICCYVEARGWGPEGIDHFPGESIHPWRNLCEHFGVRSGWPSSAYGKDDLIFGASHYGSIDDRLKHIEAAIEARLEMIEKEVA
jgi:hypothetical protein